jgi:hypothetical protein
MDKRLQYRTLPMVLFLGAVYGFLASPLTPALAAERARQVETTVGAQEAIKALVIPLPERSHRTIVNLRGGEILVPTEETLWEAEGKWRSLVENAPDVVGPSSPVRSNEIKKQRGKG